MNAGHYDYLIMSQYTEDSLSNENGLSFPIYAWVKNDPALKAVVEEPDIVPGADYVFKVNGELSPKYCPSGKVEEELQRESRLKEREEELEGG